MENQNLLATVKKEQQDGAVAVRETATEVPPIIAECRRHAENSYILSKMTAAEKSILAASTGTPIADFDNAALVKELMQMLSLIAIDVGYKKPSEPTEWTYIVTRIAEILSKYHRTQTITDIKTAFEMLIVGELDPYLPKNSNGEPDRSHYQQFGIEYITKILSAYKRRQGLAVQKARELKPPTEQKALPTAGWDKKGITRRVYDEYVKTKRLNFGGHEDVVVGDYLIELGLIEPIQITDEDKERAYHRYCIQADLGYRNNYEAKWVRIAGKDAKELQPLAYTVALHRTIKEYFNTVLEHQQGKAADKDDVSREKTETK